MPWGVVDAFARCAQHLTNLALSDRKAFALFPSPIIGKFEQYSGKPRGRLRNTVYSEVLGRIAQPLTQKFDQFDCRLGLIMDKLQKVSTFNSNQLAIGDRDGVGRT
jgi:hypothetical protein